MNRVITINLNGNAYQLDENAFDVLRAYLDAAGTALSANPDKLEIMTDLEQAIAEKCRRFLSPHKTVLLKAEIDQIILEMGPVEGGQPTAARASDGGKQSDPKEGTAPKRLYRINEGAMLGGICTGLAAYFGIDVTIVRVLWVIAAFLTSGIAIVIYLVMMIVIPEAHTSDEHAAAHGQPFNAQEIVDRATKFAKGGEKWQRRWKRRERRFRRDWRSAMDEQPWRAHDIPGAILAGVMVPVFMVINLGLFVVLWLVVHALATTGGIAGWMIPPEMPFWLAILLLIIVFGVVTSPLSAARVISQRAYGHYPTFAVWNGVVWLTVLVLLAWFGSQHTPEIRDFIQNLPSMWNDIWTRLQQR
jgi:phage shock protein PspC (stress-responsive transcriptional regulator)